MNSWNGADSYACNLKIHKLELDPEIESKLFDLLSFQEFFDSLQILKDQFAQVHQYRWQVGMNGRNGGYLVLYEGELKPAGYKSFCRSCGSAIIPVRPKPEMFVAIAEKKAGWTL